MFIYEVQASAAVPSMLIPNPAGFFVLIKSRPKVQALRTLYSLGEEVSESQGVLTGEALLADRLGDCLIDPSR